jgi:hypothetical protein
MLAFLSVSASPLLAQPWPEIRFQTVVRTGSSLEIEGPFAQFGDIATNTTGQMAFVAGNGSGLYLQSQGSVRVLALATDEVPGHKGAFFDRFTAVDLNNRGDVAFVASFFGSQQGVGLFLYRAESASISRIAASGDRVPGPVFALFQDFLNLFVNDNGDIAFSGQFRDTDVGAFLFSGGTVQAVAVANMDAPGTGGGKFVVASVQCFADDGTIAVLAGLRGGQASSGLFLYRGGALSAAVIEGQSAPGTGGRFIRFSRAALISPSGDLAFEGSVVGGQIAGGIFVRSNGAIQLVVPGGRPIPAAGQRKVASFSTLTGNPRGEWAAEATFDDQTRGIFFFHQNRLDLAVFSAQTVSGSMARRFIPTGDISLTTEGALAFVGETAEPTTVGIYVWTAGQLRAAVTSALLIPAPRRLRLSSDLGLADDGTLSFTAQMSGNGIGLYQVSEQTISPLLRMSQPAPATNGGLFADLTETPSLRHRLAGQNRLAFPAVLVGERVSMGVFRISPSTLEAIAVTNQSVPGLTRATFSRFTHAVANASGAVAFTATIDQNGSEQEALVLATPTKSLQVIAVTPQPVPGTNRRFALLATKDFWLNDRGEIAFTAELDDVSEALLLYSGGRTRVIARSGQPAPGATEETLGTFGSVMINNQGAIVFDSIFSSGEGGGVFVFAQNQLQAVALTRMPAPGTDGDVFRSFGRPAINDQGEVAFYARWGSVGRGIFLFTGGSLTAVLLSGQPLPTDDSKRFTEFFGLALNNRGDVAVAATVNFEPSASVIVLAPASERLTHKNPRLAPITLRDSAVTSHTR